VAITGGSMLRSSNWPKYASNWQTGTLTQPNGWAGYLYIPNTTCFDDHYQTYVGIINWIEGNIERPYRNAHWSKIGDCIYVNIRKKDDFARFLLRWS